ncbi:hypothetical protein ACFWA6_12525 [Streptomyces sp. NPDC060020]|uniref:hypothetical protein n=1 Tax=Streptomyces sp. NPDC060020 TaxID=3347038 RepID=UPI00368B5310
MTDTQDEALALDLIQRTEAAVHEIAALAVDTGVHFKIADIVQRVEDALPHDYPEHEAGSTSRRDVIAEMARDILSGEMYVE